MASYRGIHGVMLALEEFLKRRLPDELKTGSVNARVELFGSAGVAKNISGNVVGLYLHRVTVDPHGRNRHIAARGPDGSIPRPQLPVDLHFLLIAAGSSATIETNLLGWAMVELANEVQLDLARLAETDSAWGAQELVTILPEEMSTEDLMRIWDVFEANYTVTVPYVIRTVQLALEIPRSEGPAVKSRIFPTGVGP